MQGSKSVHSKPHIPALLGLRWCFLVLCWSLVGCVSTPTQARFRQLQLQQAPSMPRLCSLPPKGKRLLVLFASQWCAPCHQMMAELQRASKQLARHSLTPLIMWTDTKSCLRARMAGAHYPEWAFGRVSMSAQQEWGVVATPVLYLIDNQKPILRVDGPTTWPRLQLAIQRAVSSSL